MAETFAYKTIFGVTLGGSNGCHCLITPQLQYRSHARVSSKPPLLFTFPPLAKVPKSIKPSRSKHFSSVFSLLFLLGILKKMLVLIQKYNLSQRNTCLVAYKRVVSQKRHEGNELWTYEKECYVERSGLVFRAIIVSIEITTQF